MRFHICHEKIKRLSCCTPNSFLVVPQAEDVTLIYIAIKSFLYNRTDVDRGNFAISLKTAASITLEK